LGREKPYPVIRLALSMKQVRKYSPPPNPAKLTDSRCRKYMVEYDTDQSWELDALDPKVIARLIRTAVLKLRQEKEWRAAVEQEKREQKELLALAEDREN
ncbi:MAG: hypothetical protein NT049_00015, partial [Planctomycetota bacterium]|nr:hypothetical protein [Planctomycetota bacterium]